MVFKRFPRRFRKRYFKRFPIKKMIAKQLEKNVEWKSYTTDLLYQYGAIGSSWIEQGISENIAEGVTENTRVGRKLTIKSIEIRGVISQGSVGGITDDAYNVIRMVIGHFNGNTAAPMTAAGIGIDMQIDRHSHTLTKLVKKYLDKYITLVPANVITAGYTPQLKMFKYYKKFPKGITVHYGDDTSSHYDHNLVVSMISDSAAAVDPGFINGYMKVSYTDA